ncbi:hypothetical protein D3C85_1779880 [compost metagenome]
MGDAEQIVQARVEVQHAKAHVGAEAEHRGDDAEAIHRITDGAIDALADQRIQR